MIEATISVSKRAVACAHFEWADGMLPWSSHDSENYRRCRRLSVMYNHDAMLDEGEDPYAEYMGICYTGAFPSWGWPSKGSGWIPDLDDPPTLGALLALVRRLWNDPGLTVYPVEREGVWEATLSLSKPDGTGERRALCWRGKTEGEALVAALEAYEKSILAT